MKVKQIDGIMHESSYCYKADEKEVVAKTLLYYPILIWIDFSLLRMLDKLLQTHLYGV